MIHALVRMYASSDVAAKAYALLQERGLSREDHFINLVTPTTASSPEGILAAIRDGGRILAADAKVYAEGVAKGHSLVSLHAPFGAGRMYEDLLDELGPVESALPAMPDILYWDDAAPFSSALGIPALLKPSDYSFMGLPALIRSGTTTSSSIGFGELVSSNFAVFGTPQAVRDPAPFSNLFKLPTLI